MGVDTWQWVTDGTLFRINGVNQGFSFWSSGEPNNAGSEGCLSSFYDVEPKGQWNDLICSGSGYPMCEFL